MSRPEYAVFLGLDVGKEEHHACGLDPDGRRVHDKPLPQSEARIAEILTALSQHGPVLVVVDQPASIGALAVSVARSLGIDVAYMPGLAMRRIADLHPGNAKTDARDAYVIADAARTLPHALRRVDTGDEALADLEVIVGFDDCVGSPDLAALWPLFCGRIPVRAHRGHHALKSALFSSAFASLSDPTSRDYYNRKRNDGKRHNAALICLARHRVDVIYAILRDRQPYPATHACRRASQSRRDASLKVLRIKWMTHV